ncbi:hypothetical protein Tco_1155860 [Tanacetum coccineum]
MSADSAVTYTSVHSEARSWSIPSEDPYMRLPDIYGDRHHVSPDMYLSHGAGDTCTSVHSEPDTPGTLSRHVSDESCSAPSPIIHYVPSGTPPLVTLRPLPTPSTSRKADIPEADTPPRKRLLLTAPRPGCEVGESSAAAARQPGPTMARRVDCSSIDTVETRVRDIERRMMAALKGQLEGQVFTRSCLRARDKETRQAYARSEDTSRALEARITVLWRLSTYDTLEDTVVNSAYGVLNFCFDLASAEAKGAKRFKEMARQQWIRNQGSEKRTQGKCS